MAARYGDEWNGIYRSTAQFKELSDRLEELLIDYGRRPGDVNRSQMKGLVFGRDEAELRRSLDGRDAQALLDRGMIVGTPSVVVDQLGGIGRGRHATSYVPVV